MYVIEKTLDPELIEKGVEHKVMEHKEEKPDKVVGFFSDYFMAVKVRDSLNKTNG